MYFYVHMIFGLNGLLASGIALLGAYIRYWVCLSTEAHTDYWWFVVCSGSIWGGVLSTTAFLYNHGQVSFEGPDVPRERHISTQ